MIRLIAAFDRQRGIAKQGFMPWNIPTDLAYFATKTKSGGGTILVGSTTFRTFKAPLADRKNYVLTSDKTPIEGVELVHNLINFLQPYHQSDQHLWVVGGANVFAQVIEADLADEIYATQIEADFGCTQFFPSLPDTFQLVSESELHEENGFIFKYLIYARAVVR